MKTRLNMILAVALLALTGCVSTHFETKDGVKFDRTAFMNKTGIGSVEFEPATGKVKMKGYANDQTEMVAAVTEAAVRGATQAK